MPKQSTIGSLTFLLVVAMVTSATCFATPQRETVAIFVIDQAGRHLGSLFDGPRPDPRAPSGLGRVAGSRVCRPTGRKLLSIAYIDSGQRQTLKSAACDSCCCGYMIFESYRCGVGLHCGYFFAYAGGTDPCSGYYSCDVCGGACTGDFQRNSCD